jgi:hypothetical protein
MTNTRSFGRSFRRSLRLAAVSGAVLGSLVALPRLAAAADEPASPDRVDSKTSRADDGVIGTLSLGRPLQIGSTGSESERSCESVGSQCSADTASGGGIMFSVGYMWKYVGFDILGGATAEGGERRYYPNRGAQESYTMERIGGIAAVRLRGQIQSENFRATLAFGPGLGFRAVGQTDSFPGVPKDGGTYRSGAFTADLSGGWRIGRTTALVLGTMLWIENAGDDVTTYRSLGKFHLVSGTQTTLMPYLGFQFGP